MTYFAREWWEEAACRGRHDLLDLFVPCLSPPKSHGRRSYKIAPECAELCAKCPVQEICLEEGFADRYAVRGGTHPGERMKIRREERNVRTG